MICSRVGWIRLRWPTRSAGQMRSSGTDSIAARLPLTWVSCRGSRWISYSRWRLVCCMAAPVQEQLVDVRGVRGGLQGLAEVAVAEQLRQFGQQLEMGLVRLLGHEEHEQQAD